jgi:hypothetical protein
MNLCFTLSQLGPAGAAAPAACAIESHTNDPRTIDRFMRMPSGGGAENRTLDALGYAAAALHECHQQASLRSRQRCQLAQPARASASWSRHIYHSGAFFFSDFFRHNFVGMVPRCPGPKNGLERRVSQFYTICDKNQLLNKNIGKVMAILVLRSWDVSCCIRSRELRIRSRGQVPASCWLP